MSRILVLVYGVVAYLIFLVAYLYAVGFVGDLVVPKAIDDGVVVTPILAVCIDVILLLLFAIQHNVMARPWFKRVWTRIVPEPIERSTYVVAASLLLLLLYWQWRPIPNVVWQVENGALRVAIWALFFAGWGIVLYTSFLIDHFELFGLKQVWYHAVGRPYPETEFSQRSLYRWVRHPLMLGFLIAFWAAPMMSQGRLLFAIVTTAWIFVSIQIEERDLANQLGEPYLKYRLNTPMIMPWRWGGRD